MKRIMTVKEMAWVGILAAVSCVLAPISIPIGAVPITLGVFAVFIASLLLPPKLAVTSQIIYILVGIVGAPVFSNYEGGLHKVVGPTGGFILSYPLMTLVIALSLYLYDIKCKKKHIAIQIIVTIVSMLVSLVICYALGTLQFSMINSKGLSFSESLLVTVVPFIGFDLAKAAIAILIILPIRKRLKPLMK